MSQPQQTEERLIIRDDAESEALDRPISHSKPQKNELKECGPSLSGYQKTLHDLFEAKKADMHERLLSHEEQRVEVPDMFLPDTWLHSSGCMFVSAASPTHFASFI